MPLSRNQTANIVESIVAKTILLIVIFWSIASFATPPQVAISQNPLTIAIPAHPQVIFAVGNSESMDGDLSGAIRLGSGSLGSSLSLLQSSASPVNYTVPTGFTPPLNAGSGGSAPYTVTSGGNQVDNYASRLNVAKAGIAQVIQSYMPSTDFALLDYSTSSTSLYTTWVYYMSASGGFTFVSTPAAPGNSTTRTVINPCYNATGSDSVSNACSSIRSFYGSSAGVTTQPYMVIAQSSDDASINDVLYASGLSPVFISAGGPSPANPFPPNFSLANYNNGQILETYSNTYPNGNARQTGPTNAGFVPFSSQVMYVQRGFGYGGSQSATGSNTLVTMQSSGQTPTSASTSAAIARFTPFLNPETNNTGTTEIKASAGQSATAGLLAGAKNYFATNPATTNGCSAQRYVILVSDGLPTEDLAGKSWPPLGSSAGTGYGLTATFNSDGSLSSTNDQALTDAITSITNLNNAGIKTYVIGLGAGVDPTLNAQAAATLKAMSVAGGTGNYFPATTPAALVNSLQVILQTILATSQSVASTAVNSTGLHTGSAVYQAKFTTSDTYQDWTGDLFSFPITSGTGAVNTNAASATWSSKTQLDLQDFSTNRIIATWNPATSAAIPFRWGTGTTATSGITPSTTLGAALQPSDSLGSARLDYIRGSSASEQRNGGSFRNRAHKLGDIINSAPLFVGAPGAIYSDTTYLTFQNTYSARKQVVYVGADDGMLHAFDALTGRELFAFIPNGVFANLLNLTNPFYNAQHLFFADGSPQASDVKFSDGTWHTVLASGESAGGKSVYSLDVTDPATITSETILAQRVLWEFTDANMGYSYSVPAIVRTAAGFLTFFGNGYNSSTGTPYLYALNSQTGSVVSKIDLCSKVSTACNNSLANGLSSVTLVNSTGALGANVNILYAGDLQGNVWRVDVTDSNPTNWTVSVLFQARDPSGSPQPQPITVPLTVSLNPSFPSVLGTMVYFGTGQMLGTSDLSTTQTQTIYGIYDQTASGGTAPTTPLTRTSLVQQTLSSATITTTSGSTVAVRTITSNPLSLPSKSGFYVDLSLLSGERVVTDPRIEDGGGLVVTTYQPFSNLCTGGGSSYLMVLNFANGGAFPLPQLDINGDYKLSNLDQANGKNPVGISLGNVYATAPTIISASMGNAHAVKLITLSSGQIQSVVERGRNKTRTAWWEIR